jgi:hypothetical protein
MIKQKASTAKHLSSPALKNRRPHTILGVPSNKLYPIKETLYAFTNSHIRTSSLKYDYSQVRAPSRSNFKLSLRNKLLDYADFFKPALTKTATEETIRVSSTMSGLTDSTKLPVTARSRASSVVKVETGRTDPKAFVFILDQGRRRLRRNASIHRKSLPLSKPEPNPLQYKAEGPKEADASEASLVESSAATIKPNMSLVLAAGLPAKKLVRRVKDLEKTPFGTHLNYAKDFTSRYIVHETSADWLNINNSKRHRYRLSG